MKSRHRTPTYFRFGGFEGLELRTMLSGQALAAAFPPAMASSHLVGPAVAGAHSSASSSAASGTVLSAQLSATGSTATGVITYMTSTLKGVTQTQLTVGVTGAAASTTLSVSIGSTVVGSLTTDASGNGTLVLSSNPSGTQQALPANFPTSVTAATAVSVGTLTGTLATGAHGHDCAAGQGTVLATQLSATGSTATGSATYLAHTVNGVTKTEFIVSVTGATASSTLNVSIGSTVVGTITTDASGNGALVLSSNPKGTQQALPANFPTSVTAGTAVSVDTLSGTLAASTPASQGTTLTASLSVTGSTETATVTYKTYTSNGTTDTDFTVNVTGAAANSTISVSIGSTVVGTIMTDSSGNGTLALSSDPEGSEQALPANFPTGIVAGTAVTVDTLSGTLAAPTNSGGHGAGSCHGESGSTASNSTTSTSTTSTSTLAAASQVRRR